ncbi:hypothetical protein Cni_G12491 [Canna indica]|uniref:Synergin gamma C-terminal domain-containing protein n=1 Tax=Canna indica TaxID=4628 RepID=A0AAQ3Q925_9LILI|nr:hypothetical protein Cni_G12491 [Canna indica]
MPGIQAAVAAAPPRFLAFDDDDDGFGDFKFVSFAQPPSTHQPPQQQEDDDWGDFVVSPVGSHALGSAAPPPSLFDAFPSDSTADNTPSKDAKLWEKPRGALPLSIFGEEEEVEEPPQAIEPPVIFSPSFRSSSPAKILIGSVAGGELTDLITSLYGQVPQAEGGEKANSSMGEGDEDSWDFKDAFSSPNSVLKVRLLLTTVVTVIQIGSGYQREANGWSGVGSNGHDASNEISVGVGFTTTASLSKENIQDKVMHAPNGDDWFSSLDNRDRIGEEERWEFNDIFSERKIETTSGQQSTGEQKIQSPEPKVLKTTNKVEVIGSMSQSNLVDWPIHSYNSFRKETAEGSFDDQHEFSFGPIFQENVNKDKIFISTLDMFMEADQGKAIDSEKETTKNEHNSDMVNLFSSNLYRDHGFGEAQWDFLNTTEVLDRNQDSACEIDKYHSNKLTHNNVVDLYRRLKDGSICLINSHLNGLKKAEEVASLSGQQVKAMEINKEIKVTYKKLEEVESTVNPTMGEHLSIDACVNQLLEATDEPNFQSFEQEYQLTDRIISAGKNFNAAIKFLEHTTSVLILALESGEDQLAYIHAWSDLAAACAKELEQGAIIWQQSVQTQSFMQILLQEFKYFIALGEIYRVAEVIKASSKLYKPWILLNTASSTKLSASLDKCAEAWTLYGLEEALTTISGHNNVEHASLAKALLASIKVIHNLDLSHPSSYHGKDICGISLLSTKELQGGV